MKNKLLAASLVLFGTVMAGCAGNGVAVVRFGPPPPRYGIVGVAPGPGYIWTEGFWDWRGNNYVWVPGRWMRQPRARAVWVPGEWRHARNGWAFRRGHWR